MQFRVTGGVATRTGFEPVIFGVTGRYVKPLHHRATQDAEPGKFSNPSVCLSILSVKAVAGSNKG